MRWIKSNRSSVGNESACSAGDPCSILGSERSPGEGKGNPLQYSCLENPTDRGTWRAIVHGVAKVRHNLATKLLPPLTTTNLFSVICKSFFFFYIPHTSDITHLSLTVWENTVWAFLWLISLSKCPQDSYTFSQRQDFLLLYGWIFQCLCACVPDFLYPFICWWTNIGCSHILAIVKIAAMNRGLQIFFFWHSDFIPFREIPGSEIAG